MKSFWTLPFLKSVGIAALASLVLHGAFLMIQWYAISPIGFGGVWVLQFSIYPFFSLLLVLLAVPVLLFLVPFRKFRRQAVTTLICVPIFVFIGIGLIMLSIHVRMNGFLQLAQRSQPLVAAINKFVEEEGRPPSELEELVPRYLPNVPKTGMPAYPKYEYSTKSDQWHGNPWVLIVNCPIGLSKLDMFLYFPKQNYPLTGYSGFLKKIGTWAYVDD